MLYFCSLKKNNKVVKWRCARRKFLVVFFIYCPPLLLLCSTYFFAHFAVPLADNATAGFAKFRVVKFRYNE